jgi:hypothetical protein
MLETKYSMPCACTFINEKGARTFMLDPHILQVSDNLAKITEAFPLLRIQESELSIPTSIVIEYVGNTEIGKKYELHAQGVDVNTILHAMEFINQ